MLKKDIEHATALSNLGFSFKEVRIGKDTCFVCETKQVATHFFVSIKFEHGPIGQMAMDGKFYLSKPNISWCFKTAREAIRVLKRQKAIIRG